MPLFRSRLVGVLALSAISLCRVQADDIPALPLGDPSVAYMLGSAEAGQIFSCLPAGGTGAPIGVIPVETLAADLAKADVVIIGEHHTSIEGHRAQWKILDAIAATGRPFALGMEFFEIQDDGALARYSNGEVDLPTMIDETGWYSGGAYNFEYYRPLVETCRKHRAPIYGLNIPREWVREVSRKGPDGLSEEQRGAMGELGPVNERHKYLINQMMGGLGAAMPQMFDGMYRGQTTWDSAMATSILKAHKRHVEQGQPRTIVVIVGSGHMAHGLAIPSRLKARDPSLTIRTIGPVVGTLPDEDARVHPGFEKKEAAVFSLGYADYASIIPDDGSEQEYPDMGVRMDHPKGAASPTATPLWITSVTPGGVADRAGLRKDDQVLAIGADKPTSPRHAGAILGTLRWNDRVTWKIVRKGVEGQLEVPVLVVPPTDAEAFWLKSKPASGLLDSFDPTSDRSYAEQKDLKPTAAYARLVTFRNKPVRVDVLRAGVLLEAWKLDDNARPVLGLFSIPAGDGAVRVEIERDDQGKATTVRRLDGAGKPIAPATTGDPHADVAK
jgi:uncharacterized iron-regulated protein